MNFIKKYFQGIVLTFFLLGLPIGSYYYLFTGIDYYRTNKAEYQKKGVVPEYTKKDLLTNKEITNESLNGNTHIVSFFDARAPQSKELLGVMSIIQDQFQKRKDIKFITSDHYSPEFVLVDDSLNIRGYYNVMDKEQVKKLIIHLTMVMPRKKKEEVVFRREKEK